MFYLEKGQQIWLVDHLSTFFYLLPQLKDGEFTLFTLSRLLTVVTVRRVAMTPAWSYKLEKFGGAVDPRKG